jgi:hypothetical protein
MDPCASLTHLLLGSASIGDSDIAATPHLRHSARRLIDRNVEGLPDTCLPDTLYRPRRGPAVSHLLHTFRDDEGVEWQR